MTPEFRNVLIGTGVLCVIGGMLLGGSFVEAVGATTITFGLYLGLGWVVAKLTERGPFSDDGRGF